MPILTIDDHYKHMQFLINKHKSFDFSPGQFNRVWNAQQLIKFKSYLFPNDGSGGIRLTGANDTILAPFTKNVSLTVTVGKATKPTDYQAARAFRVGGKRVYFIKHSQKAAILNSKIDAPSIANNIYYGVEYDTYFELLPAAVANVEMDYVRLPAQVKWVGTPDPTQLPVYDATASVQSEWGDTEAVEINMACLKQLGVHFTSQDYAQFGQSILNNGK